MNKFIRAIVAASFLLAASFITSAQTALENSLRSLASVSSVEKLETDIFAEKYLLHVTRPVNPEAAGEMAPGMQTYVKHQDKNARKADAGTFDQRVFVMHAGYDRPTLLVTEGYWADYAMSPKYQEELSRLFNLNIVVVEYRYFGPSTPENPDWQYLTVANSLCDLHHAVEMLKPLYPGKWISTGISKGGQTTMFYRSYYPDDVDISVPYVAPLNKSLEDGRHEPFLSDKVGTAAERKVISDFMMDLASKKDQYFPLFKRHCDEKGYEFRVPVEEIYDLSVSELQFALWQWGTPVESIPALSAPLQEKFDWFIKQCEPDYFSKQSPYYSFDVMAAKELGYYGYDIRPYKEYMSVKNTKDYLRRVMLDSPENKLKFDNTLYKHVCKFLKKNDPKMIYIYGGVDPWGVSGVCTWLDTSSKKNLKYYVKEGGSHATRIGSFDESTQNEIVGTLQRWLDEK